MCVYERIGTYSISIRRMYAYVRNVSLAVVKEAKQCSVTHAGGCVVT